MPAPIEDLKNEHGVIVRMLKVMDKASVQLHAGREVDPELWEGATDFLQNFVDKCHHTKEEKHLFPVMVERGVSGEVGPIAVMLREHEDGRAHAKRLRALTADAPRRKNSERISETVRAYVDLLTMHIRKENGVVFPLADQVLNPQDQNELEARFEEVEEKVMGPGVHERYHRMIEDWTARYE
jgi:hemerythrin-like domain-containing protein